MKLKESLFVPPGEIQRFERATPLDQTIRCRVSSIGLVHFDQVICCYTNVFTKSKNKLNQYTYFINVAGPVVDIFSLCSFRVTIVFLGAQCIKTELVPKVSHVIHNPHTFILPYVTRFPI